MKHIRKFSTLTMLALCLLSSQSTGQETIEPGQPQILNITPSGYHAKWSPDGSRILYTNNGLRIIDLNFVVPVQKTSMGNFKSDYLR